MLLDGDYKWTWPGIFRLCYGTFSLEALAPGEVLAPILIRG